MSEENISQEFRLKNIDQNELMSKKHKKFIEFGAILSTYLF